MYVRMPNLSIVLSFQAVSAAAPPISTLTHSVTQHQHQQHQQHEVKDPISQTTKLVTSPSSSSPQLQRGTDERNCRLPPSSKEENLCLEMNGNHLALSNGGRGGVGGTPTKKVSVTIEKNTEETKFQSC